MLTQDMGRRLQARAIGDPNHPDEVFGRDRYPWRITESSATTVYLKNTTTAPQEYVLQLTQAEDRYHALRE